MILATSLAVLTGLALAADQVGTITTSTGTVQLFSHPGKAISGPAPHALFEGIYYSVRAAKLGDRVEKGNVLRTAPGAGAKVIYDNGDQFTVSGGTAYKISWDKEGKGAKTDVRLLYGKIRGIVEKGGPRSKLRVRTAAAVMGVRGTDFFIADGGEQGTEISILRGEVEVQNEPTTKPEEKKKAGKKDAAPPPAPKPVALKAGESASVPPPPKPEPPVATLVPAVLPDGSPTPKAAAPAVVAAPPAIEIRRTTQEELTAIQKSSVVVVTPAPKEEIQKQVADEETKKKLEKVEELEKKAVQTVLQDIKKEDPKLFAKLSIQKIEKAEDLNAATVVQLYKEAPKAPEKRKPFAAELENLENGAYERYFRMVE